MKSFFSLRLMLSLELFCLIINETHTFICSILTHIVPIWWHKDLKILTSPPPYIETISCLSGWDLEGSQAVTLFPAALDSTAIEVAKMNLPLLTTLSDTPSKLLLIWIKLVHFFSSGTERDWKWSISSAKLWGKDEYDYWVYKQNRGGGEGRRKLYQEFPR